MADILAVRGTRIEAELMRRLPDGNWPSEPDILHAGDTLTLTGIGLSAALDTFHETPSLRPWR